MLDLTLRTPGGELVALRNVVESKTGRAPTEIQRRDQQRSITVNANIAGRPLGEAAKDISEALNAIPRPAGYLFQLAGSYAFAHSVRLTVPGVPRRGLTEA